MGSTPFVGGGFGHFFAYAPTKQEYPINRYTMETKRLLDVLDRRLAETKYLTGDAYTIADMACYPWFGWLALGVSYEGASEFLDVQRYSHVQRWAKDIQGRPATRRGRKVNRTWGEPVDQLHERHDRSDFDFMTQDKIAQPA
jgi:GST-like protein